MQVELLQQVIAKAERVEMRLDLIGADTREVGDRLSRLGESMAAADSRLARIEQRFERIEHHPAWSVLAE